MGRWVEDHVPTIEGDRFVLHDWQWELLVHLYAVDERGLWATDVVGVEGPKGLGKTLLQVAVGFAELVGPFALHRPSVRVATVSGALAERDGFLAMADSMLAAAAPRGPLAGVRYERGKKRLYRSRGVGEVRVVPTTPSGVEGGNPTLVMCDEWGDWKKAQQVETWDRLLNNATKSEQPVRVWAGGIPGSAQWDGSVGWKEHKRVMDQAAGLEPMDPRRVHLWLRADPSLDMNDAAQLELALRQANPYAGDDRVRRIMARATEMSRDEYCRMFLGWWPVKGSGKLVSPALWDAAHNPDLPARPAAKARVVLALDLAWKSDSAVLVGCTLGKPRQVWLVKEWASRYATDPEEWEVPQDDVDDAVFEAMREWRVEVFVYDPPGVDESRLLRWQREGHRWGTKVVAWPTREYPRMSAATQGFLGGVKRGEVVHGGLDADLVFRWHALNAVAREGLLSGLPTPGKLHPTSADKIDALVAAIMAVDAAGRVPEWTPAAMGGR